MSATGCPDYKLDSSVAWVHYSVDRQTAEVGCHGSANSQTWQLLCRAGDWTGYVDNCSPLGIFIISIFLFTHTVGGTAQLVRTSVYDRRIFPDLRHDMQLTGDLLGVNRLLYVSQHANIILSGR